MIKTLKELKDVLASVPGFSGKVAYHAFPADKPVPLPVIVYDVARSTNFGGDNIVYHPINQIQVQLYTVGKEPATEAALEAALNAAEAYWEKTETYLPDERCYQIIYELSI